MSGNPLNPTHQAKRSKRPNPKDDRRQAKSSADIIALHRRIAEAEAEQNEEKASGARLADIHLQTAALSRENVKAQAFSEQPSRGATYDRSRHSDNEAKSDATRPASRDRTLVESPSAGSKTAVETEGLSSSKGPASLLVHRYLQPPFVDAVDKYRLAGKRRQERKAAAKNRADLQRDAKRDGARSEQQLGRRAFLQQLVELLQNYCVPSREWAAWPVNRLTGKA